MKTDVNYKQVINSKWYYYQYYTYPTNIYPTYRYR